MRGHSSKEEAFLISALKAVDQTAPLEQQLELLLQAAPGKGSMKLLVYIELIQRKCSELLKRTGYSSPKQVVTFKLIHYNLKVLFGVNGGQGRPMELFYDQVDADELLEDIN